MLFRDLGIAFLVILLILCAPGLAFRASGWGDDGGWRGIISNVLVLALVIILSPVIIISLI